MKNNTISYAKNIVFQFLIGKVQRFLNLKRVKWIMFQFLIGKVQLTAKKSRIEQALEVSIPHR